MIAGSHAGDYRLFGGYRLLLAWLVLTSHASGYLPDWVAPLALGNVGVFCFFVLSGFVIAEACDRFYPAAPQRFLVNRLLRIYPTYWVACAIAVAVYVALGHPDLRLDAASIAGNLVVVYARPGTFFWISVIWAVGIELRFYFVAAVASAAMTLAKGRETLVQGAFAVGALLLYVVTTASDFQRLATFRHAPFFVLGMALYYVVRSGSRRAAVLAAISLPLALHSYWIYNSAGSGVPIGTTLAFGVALAPMLALAYVPVPARVARVDKWLGDLTYPLYLVHWPIVYLFERVVPLQGGVGYLAIGAASLAAATGMVLALEQPLMLVRDRVRRRRLYA